MRLLRALFAAFFKLLPVRPSPTELEGTGERVRRSLPANFAIIAINGLCFPTAGRILGAGLLLTWFVSDLSDSALLVGLIVPIQYGLALMAWFFGGGRPTLLLSIFFLVIVVDAVAAGVGNIAFNDTFARIIPKRLRGRARSWRGILGGLAAAAAGLLIRNYFSQRSGVGAFGLLFAIAGLLYAVGGLIFAIIDEPEAVGTVNKRPVISHLWRKASELWREKTFRRVVYIEVLLVPITQALPFFTLFARRGFKLEVESLGLLILVDAAAPIAGSVVWGRLADAFGNRHTIVGSATCGLLAPAISLTLYAVGGEWRPSLLLSAFAGVVFTVGVAQAGIDLATKNYVLDLARNEAERPLYIGFNDTLIGVPTMLLVATGLIIDLFGFLPVFIGLSILTLAGAFVALSLPAYSQP